MWGIIPAAGSGSRIQPLAFSKELLPVGSQTLENVLRPKAVSEYLIERMAAAGVEKICFVISQGKSDIMRYYGSGTAGIHFCYTVQPKPCGLCDALFRALPFVGEQEDVVIGLPDTIWFPENALRMLPSGTFSLLLFPVDKPEYYDAVRMDEEGCVKEVFVKKQQLLSRLVWGAVRVPGKTLRKLHTIWKTPGNQDEYLGTLINKFIAAGEEVKGISAGTVYVDVGTVNGYYEAVQLLGKSEIVQTALQEHLT